MRGPKYGAARDYVLGLEVVLGTGELVRAGSRAIKNATGYNLPQFFVGLGGEMGVITEATIRLVSRPAVARSAVAFFPSPEQAVRAAIQLATEGVEPAAVELLDDIALGYLGVSALEGSSTNGLLLISVLGANGEDVARQYERLAAVLRSGGASEVRRLANAESDRWWDARREAPARMASADPLLAFVEVVLPRSGAADVVARLGAMGSVDGRLARMGSVASGELAIAIPGGDAGLVRGLCEMVAAAGGVLLDVRGPDLCVSAALEALRRPGIGQVFERISSALDPRGTLSTGRLRSASS